MSLLKVQNLHVSFDTPEGKVTAVHDINFQVAQGEVLGLVGESGSGKSMTAFSVMGLLPGNAQCSGEAVFQGQDLFSLTEHQLNQVRASKIAIVFQNPMTSLNPYMKVEKQLTEVLKIHSGMNNKDAFEESVRMLNAVKIPQARQRMLMYPHELSGGMRQRVMIAMALLCRPELLIADEPTTALDVTVQAQITALLKELRSEFNTSILMITHDLALVAGLCDRIIVMHNGYIVESGDTDDIFNAPQQPYTKALLTAAYGRGTQ